jgi:hypothetical protein
LEQETGVALEGNDREAVMKQLEPWAALLRNFDAEYHLTDEMRGRMLSDLRDNFEKTSRLHSPGMFLARRLANCLNANVARRPLRSDSVDSMHASYFPYVDVATCDGQVFACLSPHVPTVRGPRNLRLFRNGQLRQVVSTLAEIRDSALSSTATDRGKHQ